MKESVSRLLAEFLLRSGICKKKRRQRSLSLSECHKSQQIEWNLTYIITVFFSIAMRFDVSIHNIPGCELQTTPVITVFIVLMIMWMFAWVYNILHVLVSLGFACDGFVKLKISQFYHIDLNDCLCECITVYCTCSV